MGTFDPLPLPLTTFGHANLQLIATYWADSDTRPDDGGWVWYRATMDETLKTKATDLIKSSSPNRNMFSPDYLFIATWDRVGYFNRHTDKVKVYSLVSQYT